MTQYWRISLFAMMLASAGLPIYIHLPRFASVDLGINLATVGAIVLGIRIMDFIQDPIIGRIIDKWRGPRDQLALIGMSIMALGFVMLFSITPPINAAVWMTVSLILVFTGYSFGSILMYGESAALAGSGSESAQLRLATFRKLG
jgi:Na+/melibiose symporter-like transporter